LRGTQTTIDERLREICGAEEDGFTESANEDVDVGGLQVGGKMLDAAAFELRGCSTSTNNEKTGLRETQ
jgi:hypothetical protein